MNPTVFFNIVRVCYSKQLRLVHVKGLPYYVMLEPTSHCNLHCPMCARTILGVESRKPTQMDISTFNAIFRKLAPYQMLIAFWNFGEPLLNEDLFEMIRVADRKRIISAITTNGVLLDERKASLLVGSGLDYIAISLDAGRPETYRKYRPEGKFETVVSGIEFLSRERRRQQRGNPFIEVTCLVMRDNEMELDILKAIAMRSGADKVSFKKVSFVKDTMAFDPSSFLPSDPRFLSSVHKKPSNKARYKSFCRIPWEHMVINADGTVVPCCQDFGNLEPMGNLATDSLENIWNGENFQKIREKILRTPHEIELCSRWCSERDFDHGTFI